MLQAWGGIRGRKPQKAAEGRLQKVLQELAEALDPVYAFSVLKCREALMLGVNEYLNTTPGTSSARESYPTSIHNAALKKSVACFWVHARGPAAAEYEVKLREVKPCLEISPNTLNPISETLCMKP